MLQKPNKVINKKTFDRMVLHLVNRAESRVYYSLELLCGGSLLPQWEQLPASTRHLASSLSSPSTSPSPPSSFNYTNFSTKYVAKGDIANFEKVNIMECSKINIDFSKQVNSVLKALTLFEI